MNKHKNGQSEIWKDIPGYYGLYRVSTYGRVKSMGRLVVSGDRVRCLRPIELRPGTDKDGYKSVQLSKEGLQLNYRVHRLVALSFIANPNNYPFINHIDSDPSNNCVWNLEWCTHLMNMRHMIEEGRKNVTNRKIPQSEIHNIISLYKAGGITMDKIAARYNVTRPVIGYIINNKTYKLCQQI